MKVLWTAVLKDQEIITNNDLIYHDIKNRLEDLVSLTVRHNERDFTLIWRTKEFVAGPLRFSFPITNLDNCRPICFLQEQVEIQVTVGQVSPPQVSGVGLGYQGTCNGKNVKYHIFLSPDGKFTIGMKQ